MCQEMLDQLAQNTEWFNARGVRVAAVTMGKPYEAKMFCAQRSPDVVCLSNPDQSAYQEFNIGKITAQDVLNPASWRAWGRDGVTRLQAWLARRAGCTAAGRDVHYRHRWKDCAGALQQVYGRSSRDTKTEGDSG